MNKFFPPHNTDLKKLLSHRDNENNFLEILDSMFNDGSLSLEDVLILRNDSDNVKENVDYYLNHVKPYIILVQCLPDYEDMNIFFIKHDNFIETILKNFVLSYPDGDNNDNFIKLITNTEIYWCNENAKVIENNQIKDKVARYLYAFNLLENNPEYKCIVIDSTLNESTMDKFAIAFTKDVELGSYVPDADYKGDQFNLDNVIEEYKGNIVQQYYFYIDILKYISINEDNVGRKIKNRNSGDDDLESFKKIKL